MTSPSTDRRLGLLGSTALKTPVTVVATANITQRGEQTIDGVAVHAVNAAGVPDRVLCTGQTDSTQNGIWDVSLTDWTRSLDADGNYDLKNGTVVMVGSGSANGQTAWSLSATEPVAPGSSVMAWAKALWNTIATAIFLQSGAGAVARGLQDKVRDTVCVLDYMTPAQIADVKAGTALQDVTTSFAAAFVVAKNVYAPAGTYLISAISIPANTSLSTDGFSTALQQKSGTAVGTRIISVTGSNVTIGDLMLIGNIATDTDEQNHGIFVQASAGNGNLNNIRIGDIYGKNLRGDVVYAGQATSANLLSNVRIGRVTCDNVYRNGVSIVSGDGITLDSVSGSTVGFCHLDIESNVGSGPCTNIHVRQVKGRNLGMIAQSAADYIDSVEIENVDLSPANAGQSTPNYAPGVAIADGLLLRNVVRGRIGNLKIVGFNRCAAFVTMSAGELGVQMLEIGTLYMRTCSLTDVTYNSYFNAAKGNTRIKVDYVDVVITQASKRAFDGISNSQIGSVLADIEASSILIRNSDDVVLGNVVQTGANGFMLSACNRVSVKGGSFTGDRLATSCDKCSFENFTATAAVFLFSSGQEDHSITNSTLNTVYYGFGTGKQTFAFPLAFGPSIRVWSDSHAMLYVKNGIPTTDTDGNPMGQQVAVPASAVASGRPGYWAADVSFYYAYTGDGTTHSWRRVATAAW